MPPEVNTMSEQGGKEENDTCLTWLSDRVFKVLVCKLTVHVSTKHRQTHTYNKLVMNEQYRRTNIVMNEERDLLYMYYAHNSVRSVFPKDHLSTNCPPVLTSGAHIHSYLVE